MKYFILTLLTLISGFAHAEVTPVGAGLVIAPTKLIFKSGEAKSQTLTLINNGDKKATYRITPIYKTLNPDGSFSEIPMEEADNALGSLLRFSPRQVTIDPDSSQKVRVMLRSTSRFKEKEFSARLLFRAIPEIEESTAESDIEKDKLGFKLTALYGISLPVLYWPEGSSSSSSYENISHNTTKDKLNISFDLMREGTRSSYQNISISWKNPDGKVIPLQKINDIAIYYPQTKRIMEIEVDKGLTNTAGTPVIELENTEL